MTESKKPTGPSAWRPGAGFAVVLLLALGCSSAPSSPPEAPLASTASPAVEPEPQELTILEQPRPDQFSGKVAAAHEALLNGLRPRRPGSQADAEARSYLTREFLAAGARVWEVADGSSRHLLAELSGDSPDILMLVAPYSLVDPDLWVGDTGAAFLLELARNLGRERSAYTLRFVLAETRAEDGLGRPLAVETVLGAREHVVAAGVSLARALAGAANESRGVLRGVIVFDAPARPGLRFARDLRSHPIYREVFWSAASRLGSTELFPPSGGWSSPQSLHAGLEAAADGKVLALVDESWTRPERKVAPSSERSDEVFEQSGRVTLEALGQLMHRLARIDGFGDPEQALRGDAASPVQPSPGILENPPSS